MKAHSHLTVLMAHACLLIFASNTYSAAQTAVENKPGLGSFSQDGYVYLYSSADAANIVDERLTFNFTLSGISIDHNFENRTQSAFSDDQDVEYLNSRINCLFDATIWNQSDETIALPDVFEMIRAGVEFQLNPPMRYTSLEFVAVVDDLEARIFIKPGEGIAAQTRSWTTDAKFAHTSNDELYQNAETLAKEVCNVLNVVAIKRLGGMESLIAESEKSGTFNLTDHSGFLISQPLDLTGIYINHYENIE